MLPRRTLLTLAAFGLCIQTAQSADPFVREDFKKPLDEQRWVVPPSSGLESAGGQLVWTLRSGEDSRDFAIALRRQTPVAGLNFIRHPVKVSLQNLDLGGDGGSAAGRVFMLIIASDAQAEEKATSYMKLRVNGEGAIGVAAAGIDKDGKKGDRNMIEHRARLPIRSLVLDLGADMIRLTVQDADGTKMTEGRWKESFDPQPWQSAAPFLILKGVRKAEGGGTPQIRLGGLSIQ